MTARKRLMSLSLIALAVFSACTDEVENGGQRPVKGDHSLSFAVSTPGSQTWTKADGTRAASTPATQQLEPVEMEGKVNGKTVYLTAEVTDGFPGDNRIMTRGTQVTEDNKTKDGIMETFAVSAYTSLMGTPDFMYSVPATKGNPENGTYYWYPEEKFYWPGVKSLNFYAWYPHTANAEGLTVSGADENGTPKLHYTAPNDVKKQMDVMTAVATNQAEQEAIPLTFNHALSAVKFVAGSDLSNCVVKSVKLSNLQYEGTYDIASSTWTEVKSDKKDFTVSWGYNAVEGTEGSPVTREDETFFLVPQTLDGAKVEVTFMNTDNTKFTVGAALSGTWEKGKTYIYKISYNFVYIGVSNEKFVAYVDKTDEMKDQIAFYVNFSSSDPNDTRMIFSAEDFDQNAEISVTPKTITPGSNIPIKISWKGKENWVYTEVTISKSLSDFEQYKDDKRLWVIRPDVEANRVDGETNIFEEDGGFWVYSLPETTSQPFKDEYSDGDIIEVQNITESDWLAITPLSTYNKKAKYQAIYNNASKGDIYLQTLSVPTENRFASLLACKEDFKQNIMYCVEQKAFTADFGFKDCERNISREAEKWNIAVTGGRFKDGAQIKARVVMDAGQDGVTDDGSLTYGDDALITCTSTGGTSSYVKKRWDTQENTAANNGKRTVHLQIQNASVDDDWIDLNVSGTMHDWMTWGKDTKSNDDFVIAHGSSGVRLGDAPYGSMNKYNYCIAPLYTTCWNVHKDHPFFGTTQWQCTGNTCDDPAYMWWSAAKGANNVYVRDVSENKSTLSQLKAIVRAMSTTNAYTYKDYIEGRLSTPGQYVYVPVQGARWYTDSEGARYFTTSETATSFAVKYIQNRPTNDTPIEQETIYNNYRAYSDKYK